MFVLDSHCDTPSQIFRLRDLTIDNGHAHVDFPKMRKGGVDAVFFALYIPPSLSQDAALAYAAKLLSLVYDTAGAGREEVCVALTPEEAFKNREKELVSIFLALENGSPIGESTALLRLFYRMGIRYMTLCHSAHNAICDSCTPAKPMWGGLSPFGREALAEMNRLGMMIDVSHASDASFYDILEYSKAPVVASHSSCRALACHPRNMTDDMIRALAERGGVIQINFFPSFLDDGFRTVLAASGLEDKGEEIEKEFISDPADASKRAAWYSVMDELSALPRPSYKRVVDHIDHAVSVAGIDHVGLGSDFDGIAVTPEGLEDISKISVVFDEMRARGYTEDEIAKVAGGNFMRVLGEVQNLAQ